MVVRFLWGVCQSYYLVMVGVEDILFSAAEVGIDLPRQQCVFRDVGSPRVIVQRQQEKPGNSYKDAECREIGW